MSKEEVNNPESTPIEGQVDEKAGGSEDYSKLSTEELERMAKGEPAPVSEVKDEPVKTEEKTKEPAPVKEPTEELPEELKGKSPEELAKAYINLRKLQSTQTDELGNLRKYKKETEEVDEQLKQYGVNSTAQTLVEKEIFDMNDDEKNKFYEKFSESPAEALMPLIQRAIKPLTVRQARSDNEAEVKRLEEKTKDGYVPYDRKKINKIIAGFTKENGRNELFDKHGKGAFEAAYDIYYKENIGQALEKSQKEFKEKALKEAEEAAKSKPNTFTEPQGPSSASKGGKPTDYETMPMEQLEKLVGKPKDY